MVPDLAVLGTLVVVGAGGEVAVVVGIVSVAEVVGAALAVFEGVGARWCRALTRGRGVAALTDVVVETWVALLVCRGRGGTSDGGGVAALALAVLELPLGGVVELPCWFHNCEPTIPSSTAMSETSK